MRATRTKELIANRSRGNDLLFINVSGQQGSQLKEAKSAGNVPCRTRSFTRLEMNSIIEAYRIYYRRLGAELKTKPNVPQQYALHSTLHHSISGLVERPKSLIVAGRAYALGASALPY